MTDFAPVNYGAMQPQHDFGQTLANGLATGDLIHQRQLETQKLAEQQRLAQQMQADVTTIANNPDATAEDYAGLGTKYPQFADKFKQSWNMIDDKHKEAKVNLYGNAYAAISNGNIDLASQLIKDQADAYRNAGDDKKAKEYDFASDMINKNPAQAKMMAGMFLSQAMGADKFVSTFSSLNKEQRDQEQAPVDLRKKEADATSAEVTANNAQPLADATLDKAKADATSAQVTADNAPEKQAADIADTKASTIEKTNKPILDAAKLAAKDDPLGINDALSTGATGDELLASLPKGLSSQVKALAEGKMAFPSGKGLTSDKVQQLLQAVAQYDPSFDAADYNKRNRTATNFSAGKQGDAVKAVNQTLAHMAGLKKSIDDLNNFNGMATPLNGVKNYLQENTGDKRQGLFKLNVQAVSSELRKVFSGSGGGSLTELEEWKNSIPLNASHEQQAAYLQKGVELLHGGIDALENQYQAGMGTSRSIKSLLSPKAQKTLNMFDGIAGDTPTQSSAPAAATVLKVSPAIAAKAKQLGWSNEQLQQFLRDHSK